jgi:hypothetical protein
MTQQNTKLFRILIFLFFSTTLLIIYWNCYHLKLYEKVGNVETNQSMYKKCDPLIRSKSDNKKRNQFIRNQSIHGKSMFIVLLWTKYLGKDFEINGGTTEGLKCGLKNLCVFTNDKSALNESSAVVYNWVDLIEYPEIVFPKRRLNNQRWVLFSQIPVYEEKKFISRLMDFDGKINWIMTYRRDSDIYAPHAFISKNADNFKSQRLVSLRYKPTQCATVVKHCQTDSRREKYIKELRNFIEIDVYGNCSDSKNDCLNLELKDCYSLLEKEYKFFLYYENGI